MGAKKLNTPKTNIPVKKPFVVQESYKHLFAKNLLAKWLKDEEDREKDFCKLAQFPWRVNAGIFTELPFYKTSSPFYFENSKGICGGLMKEHPKEPLKWFDNKNKGKILFVPDIVVFHKGTPLYIFEIVHKNPVSPKKMLDIYNFFFGLHYEVHMIEAEEILSNTHVPQFINTTQIL